jgi:hypothetical protein
MAAGVLGEPVHDTIEEIDLGIGPAQFDVTLCSGKPLLKWNEADHAIE